MIDVKSKASVSFSDPLAVSYIQAGTLNLQTRGTGKA